MSLYYCYIKISPRQGSRPLGLILSSNLSVKYIDYRKPNLAKIRPPSVLLGSFFQCLRSRVGSQRGARADIDGYIRSWTFSAAYTLYYDISISAPATVARKQDNDKPNNS